MLERWITQLGSSQMHLTQNFRYMKLEFEIYFYIYPSMHWEDISTIMQYLTSMINEKPTSGS